MSRKRPRPAPGDPNGSSVADPTGEGDSPPAPPSADPTEDPTSAACHIERRILVAIREARFPRDTPRPCPRCSSTHTIRWGRTRGRQRYRCHGCHRTFSDLTATPLAYTKLLSRWPAFGDCMAQGLSVRATARRLGIHKDTAFRWRHRLARAYDTAPDAVLGGMVALSVAALPHSEKGRRPQGRPPRTRRGRVLDPRVRKVVHVVFLGAESAPTWEFVSIEGTRGIFPPPLQTVRHLGPRIHPGSQLVGTSRLSDLTRFAWLADLRLRDNQGRLRSPEKLLRPRERRHLRARAHQVLAEPLHHGGKRKGGKDTGEKKRTPGRSPSSAAVHPAPGSSRRSDTGGSRLLDQDRARGLALLNEARRRSWSRWLRRFRGVASHYLRSYLAWHRQLHLCLAGAPHVSEAQLGLEPGSRAEGGDRIPASAVAWGMVLAAAAPAAQHR